MSDAGVQAERRLPFFRHLSIAGIAVLAAAVLVFPAFLLFAGDVSLIAIANESLAYRFFYSLRLMSGTEDVVFLPQGQALTALNHLFHLLIGTVPSRPEGLREALDQFGYLTFGANFLLLAGGFLILFASPTTTGDRLLVLACGLFATYGSRFGMSAAITPDYYAFEASLTILSLSVALAMLRCPPGARPKAKGTLILGLGVLAGVAIALKITLIATAALPVLALAARHRPSPVEGLVWGLGWFLTAAATLGLVILASYAFHPARLIASIPRWWAFLANPGSEPGFWASLFFWRQGANGGASYGYALLVLPVATAMVMLRLAKAAKGDRLLPAALLLLLAIHLYGLIHRPARTTLWEITIFAAAAGILAAASLSTAERTRASIVLVLVLAGQTIAFAAMNWAKLMDIDAFQSSSNNVWEAHAKLMSSGDGAVFLVLDNNHTAGTIAEALLKGSSDMPTWNITTGRRLLIAVAPGLEIVQTLDYLDRTKSVMWVDILGNPSLSERFPALAARQRATKCIRWQVQNWEWWPRVITVCPAETIAR